MLWKKTAKANQRFYAFLFQKYVQALLLERYLNNLNVQRNVCANDDIKQPTSTPAEQAKMLREITQQEAEAKVSYA